MTSIHHQVNTEAPSDIVALGIAHEVASLPTEVLQAHIVALLAADGDPDADRRRRLTERELTRRLLAHVERIGGDTPRDARCVAAMLGWLALPSDAALTEAGAVALHQLEAGR